MDQSNIAIFSLHGNWQWNQTGKIYFQQHLLTSLALQYIQLYKGDYGTVGRASIAAGGRLVGCSASAAHGPKESTTSPGTGNCNLQRKK
jgi:hypothetical protein